MSNKARTWLFSIATGVWGLNYLAPLVIHAYEPSGGLTLGLSLIIGGLTVSWRKRREDDEQDRTEE